MNFDVKLEQKLKSAVLKYLEKGRPNWDVPHTLAAVHWIKELLKHEIGDPKILITTIYLHDIGYANKLKKGYGFQDNQLVRPDHMVHGEILAKKILKKIGGYTEDEIKKIAHLVKIHDELDKIDTPEVQLVFEADSIASIDVERVKPNFDKKNYLEFLDFFEKERVPRFKTKIGKKFLKKVLEKAKRYFE